MSWLDRFAVEPVPASQAERQEQQSEEDRMGPGLTGHYDETLREKAASHMPPPPPEHMGLEGEYDEAGLAKRVAAALNQDPIASGIEHLHLVQSGRTIRFEGQIENPAHLQHVATLAAQVDGTEAVDTSRVMVERS